MFIFRQSQIYIILGLGFLIMLSFFALMFSTNNTPVTPSSSPLPKPVFSSSPLSSFPPLYIKPVLTTEVPLKPVSEGGGADLSSSVVQNSQTEIAKLLPHLPYRNVFTITESQTISVLIPGREYQTTPWVLDVQIFGIDYQVTENDSEYTIHKTAFLSTAANIFAWIKSKNANPENIIINWGDRLYIRERAEEWLNE